MSTVNFDFGNAVSHFQKTGGPKGFLWKFGLAYGLAYLVLMAIYLVMLGPLFALSMNPDAMADPYALEQDMAGMMGQIFLAYAIVMIGYILIYMMFEAASQRRYIRGEGFSLRLGGDEWRLLAVGLLYMLLIIGLYIGTLLVVGLPAGIIAGVTGEPAMAAIVGVVAGIAYFVFALWVIAKFSAAAALTVRDGSIQFGKSWSVTKGKAWTILGSWIVLYLLTMVVFFVLYIIVFAIVFAGMFSAMSSDPAVAEDPEAMMAAFMSPATLIPMVLIGFGFCFLSGIIWHVFGGPAALAARTDPAFAGETPETFS